MRGFHAWNPMKNQQRLATGAAARSMKFHRRGWKENA
jgi:hypothetical protein